MQTPQKNVIRTTAMYTQSCYHRAHSSARQDLESVLQAGTLMISRRAAASGRSIDRCYKRVNGRRRTPKPNHIRSNSNTYTHDHPTTAPTPQSDSLRCGFQCRLSLACPAARLVLLPVGSGVSLAVFCHGLQRPPRAARHV